MITSKKYFGDFHHWIVLSSNCILLIVNSAILIFIYLQTYFGVSLALSSQTVGSLLRTPAKAGKDSGKKSYTWKHSGSVQLTSLYLQVQIRCFKCLKIFFLIYLTTFFNEEVNCTEPTPSVRIPCTSLYTIS